MIELFSQPETWISLATLSALEIVLGIDNIVFITIVAGKLPPDRRPAGRRVGLALALITRLALLASLTWVMGLTAPLFSLFDHPFSGRDLILIGGGLFLIAKATVEVYDKVEAAHPAAASAAQGAATFGWVIFQIMLLDMVFSLDSVITAIGMVKEISIMVTAVVLAMIVMIIFANAVGNFVERHPSIKILALAFLVMIGALLVAEGTGRHLEKGYVYFAMAFSLGIELLNMRYRARQERAA
ncbi:MAG TPA: TerC family protein [Thermoanaerobaculia bacterium]|jgi:predicted tellurium resistance membrane protein TerC